MFAHFSRRIRLDHRGDSSIFERTLSQFRLNAATARLDDNQLSVRLHASIICPAVPYFANLRPMIRSVLPRDFRTTKLPVVGG